jgi:hypothetical protein
MFYLPFHSSLLSVFWSACVLQGVFVVPDAPKPEEVPEGAVDSTGNPVNVLLYQQFWELQVRPCYNIMT